MEDNYFYICVRDKKYYFTDRNQRDMVYTSYIDIAKYPPGLIFKGINSLNFNELVKIEEKNEMTSIDWHYCIFI